MNNQGNDLNYLEISRELLRYNAGIVKQYVQCPVIGVLKCDGYGVTISEAAQAWKSCKVTMFAVSEPQEAFALRTAGFGEDILLLSPVADASTLNALLDEKVILTVTGMETARFYSENARGQTIRAHLAVDTGMGRFGVRWSDLEQLKAIYSSFCFRFEGIFSHFSASFEKRYRITKKQLSRFLSVTEALSKAGYGVGMRHIANSCAALRFPETRLDAVRIGSALIGELCATVPVDLQPVGVFQAQVVDRKRLLRGDATGYASVCRMKRDTDAIVVALGHENGFGYLKSPDNFRLQDLARYFYRILRARFHRPCVMYGEHRLSLIGRIGSQYSLFDATGTGVQPGEYVASKAHMLYPNQRRRMI